MRFITLLTSFLTLCPIAANSFGDAAPATPNVPSVRSTTASEIEAGLAIIPGFMGTAIFSSTDIVPGVTADLAKVKGKYTATRALSKGPVSIKAADIEIEIEEVAVAGPDSSSANGEQVHEQIQGMQNANLLGFGDNIGQPGSSIAIAENDRLREVFNDALFCVGMCGTDLREETSLVIADGKISIKGETGSFNAASPLSHIKRIIEQHRANELIDENLLAGFENKRLEQYPLIAQNKLCVSNDPFLNRFYSSDCSATALEMSKVFSLKDAPYIRDVLRIVTQGIETGEQHPFVESTIHYPFDGMVFVVSRKDPLHFVHCQDEAELAANSKHLVDRDIGGYYSTEYNVVTFQGDAQKLAPHFVHEAAHAVMNIVFKNGAKPFGKDNATQKAAYEHAEIECFKNLARVLGVTDAQLQEMSKTEDVIDFLKYKSDERPPRSMLNLSEDDERILNVFGTLLGGYNREEIALELIVRIPQLIAMGVSTEQVARYFGPLMQYWNTFVSSYSYRHTS